jgi:hypothetical protein
MSLTTLAHIKAFKNLATDEHDQELLRLQAVVESALAGLCNRTFEQSTVTEYHSPFPGQPRCFLKRPPLVSITSVHDDPARAYGAETLVDPSAYAIEDEGAGILTFDGHTLAGGLRSLKVVYVGGFSPIPPDLAQAAIELIWLTRDLGDKALLGVAAKQIADGSITMYQRNRLDAVRELLDRYRLLRI